MRKKLSRFLTTSLFAASLVFAQTTHTPPDPAAIVQRQVAHLTTLLTLTTAQQQQATTIFTASVTASMTARASQRTARQALSAAIKNNDAGGIEQSATSIGNLTAQQALSDAKAQAAFLQILTPDQVTKYNQLGAGGGQGFGHGPGPGGNFRGGPGR